MTDERRSADPHPPDDDEPRTTGAVFLMLVFLMALGGMWMLMYLELLQR